MKKILIAGDLFPSRINENLFIEGNTEKLLGNEIEQLFQRADFSVCNLEGTLTTSSKSTPKLGPNIKANPKSLTAYKKMGISLLATANNHVNDYSQEGYIDTQKAITEYGLEYIGSGSNISDIKKFYSVSLDGVIVCFYNVAETMFNVPSKTTAGVHLYDEYAVCKDIESLKKVHDIVVVIYHGGIEYFPYPTLELRKRFHRMADSGADIILAQHTHCIGCEEKYNNSYLLYGQGNFLFDRSSSKECTKHGLAIEVLIDSKGAFTINKYWVKLSDGCISLVSNPDYTEFIERGSHINDDEYIVEKLKNFVMTQKSVKTKQFISTHWYDNLLSRFLPHPICDKYKTRFKSVNFTKAQLMRILYTVRSEQQREAALYMVLKDLEQHNVFIK